MTYKINRKLPNNLCIHIAEIVKQYCESDKLFRNRKEVCAELQACHDTVRPKAFIRCKAMSFSTGQYADKSYVYVYENEFVQYDKSPLITIFIERELGLNLTIWDIFSDEIELSYTDLLRRGNEFNISKITVDLMIQHAVDSEFIMQLSIEDS